MEVEVNGSDPYACPAYKLLFETIMNDVGKAILVERAKLVLKPEIPLFIFSVKLVNEPVNKTIADVASTRQEGNETHLSISDEKYAPEILSQLWKNYGRDNVDQQTRFDLVVTGGDEDKIKDLLLSRAALTVAPSPTAQEGVKRTASPLISPDVLVDALVAHAGQFLEPAPPSNLLGAEAIA